MSFENCSHFIHFKGQTILAIDFGTKVTGLASFCPGRDPFPLIYGKIIYQNHEQLIRDLKKICVNEGIDILVLGLPLFTDGKESEATKKVKLLAEQMEDQLKLPLYLQDETLTTFEAKERMKNSPRYQFKVDMKAIDELSALIILEDFIQAEFLKTRADLAP